MRTSISKKQLREFGFLIGIAFPLLVGWIIPLLTGHQFREWTLWVGLPSILLGFLSPKLLLYPYKGWMALGLALGFINSHIILGLVFIVVMQPIALIMRIFRYDPLRKKKNDASSYRELRSNPNIDLNRIF